MKREKEGEREREKGYEYLLLLLLSLFLCALIKVTRARANLESAFSSGEKEKKRVYLKAELSFSLTPLPENKEQHSRLEHRLLPCPCLLTVINARPLMCTLRRGYRLNDAQLAKKPGTMAAQEILLPPPFLSTL